MIAAITTAAPSSTKEPYHNFLHPARTSPSPALSEDLRLHFLVPAATGDDLIHNHKS